MSTQVKSSISFFTRQVIDKGCFSEAFSYKPRGGRSPPSVLNRSQGRILYFACSMAQAQINTCYCHLTKFTFAHPAEAVNYFTFTGQFVAI